jgi:hypothetical protein
MSEEDFKLVPDTESKFPDYTQLSKNWDKEEFITFAINGDYLAELCSQLAKLSKFKKVEINIPKKYIDGDAHKIGLPIKIKTLDATAYLMPMENK